RDRRGGGGGGRGRRGCRCLLRRAREPVTAASFDLLRRKRGRLLRERPAKWQQCFFDSFAWRHRAFIGRCGRTPERVTRVGCESEPNRRLVLLGVGIEELSE